MLQFELGQISEFNFTEGLSSIRRVNQEKQLTVKYRFIEEVNDDKDVLEASRADIDELISQIRLPQGMAIEVVHEDESLGEFSFLLFAAFILIYMILASVFESFVKPAIMMFSIPMAAIGSLIALMLTGNSIMNANVLTGFIILLGIVVNNGIILIDYSSILQKRGYKESRALMMAGLARVRPILITATTTIVALIPLAMGRAEYVTRIGVPFAITVIGGLATSTVLTLVFIPTFNSGLQAALKWIRKQNYWIKIVMAVGWLSGTLLVFAEVDSRIWQLIYFVLLLVVVPAIIFFIQNSLRKANEKLIQKDQFIRIRISKLVKIYDRDNKFIRDWKSGINMRERLEKSGRAQESDGRSSLLWQFSIICFLIYLIYFHLQSGFWYLILPVFLYLVVLQFLDQGSKPESTSFIAAWIKRIKSVLLLFHKLFFWLFPAISTGLFYLRHELLILAIPVAIIWYFALFVKITSDRFYKNRVDINRIKGGFSGIRKAFYRLVLIIPFIGKKKVPFKAVKSVSLQIENGMFGLLGPNGAGKSTLMRIICGILDQSYGQITINGMDVRKKREELQGLIGYLPQEFGMYENLTAGEFLHYMGILKNIYHNGQREQRIDYVLKAVHMLQHKNEKIGSFSGGMKQRIGIAHILMHLPRILVVDEPTAGLDPRERIRFRNLLVELSKERIVIFSTHIIEDVASSCNRVAVMKEGSVLYLGAPVHMASIAEGRVWAMTVPEDEFEELKKHFVVIHHMSDGGNIRLRCIADNAPSETAIQAKANLEDAYLCLLNQSNLKA